ncbi:uncharacterized protein [Spinacia oleracea]|uniref:Reverse transcriptase zinc-binding domain-containing protein n=1 Tax=Spinacia oleracea TaxID=3562 RepID=A0ABM3R0I7_SPIOL|nr:uncharacterized protein LOC130463885 [Spinacia oleracea]
MDVMKELGFPEVFLRWIMECISSVTYSILINGQPCLPFPAKKGLRQGDPLSPFIFAIGMEYLSRSLMQLKADPNFNFHPKWLEANLDKSNAYICGVSSDIQQQIMLTLNIPPGGTDCSKKALVAWSHMCLPKTAGGWNIKDMEIWNKAVVCKLLWAITHKKDRLWSRWVDGYYMKGRPIADVHCPSTMSWSLKKIIGCKELVTNVGGWSAVEKDGCFSIKPMYRKLCGDHPKFPWRRLLCNNLATPKSLFIMWIAIWKRLPTLDRLFKWGVVTSEVCPVCSMCSESAEHLFFTCTLSCRVWQKVLDLLHFKRRPEPFGNEMQWVIKSCKRSGSRHKLLGMFFAECICSIWLNRNEVVYNQVCKTPEMLFRQIQFHVASRSSDVLSSTLLNLSR